MAKQSDIDFAAWQQFEKERMLPSQESDVASWKDQAIQDAMYAQKLSAVGHGVVYGPATGIVQASGPTTQALAAQEQMTSEHVQVMLSKKATDFFKQRMAGMFGDFTLGTSEHIHCQILGDEVFIFYIFDGDKVGVQREPIDLFPSDQLITQFRLIRS